MDDMVFQYNNNQNSIYVLNSNYAPYADFPRLSFVDPVRPVGAKDGDGNYQRAAAASASAGGRVCSTVGRTLQHKLKTLGNFHGADTEAIGNPAASSASSAACLPAAAAIQKLFTCSSAASSYARCAAAGERRCVARDAAVPATPGAERDNEVLRSGAAAAAVAAASGGYNGNGGGGGGGGGGSGSGDGNKKKCANIKSNIIAKKTKFLKFLEEEKWRASEDSGENFNATSSRSDGDSDRDRERRRNSSSAFSDNSCVNRTNCDGREPSALGRKQGPSNGGTHYTSNKAGSSAIEPAAPERQQRGSQWSGSHDAKQQQQRFKEKEKSSLELYKEAADLLGLSCTLCDNCRCMDCQSGYFDCDDSDSGSEFSLMDEYENDAAAALMIDADNFDSAATPYCQHEAPPQQQHQQPQQLDEYHNHSEWCSDCGNCNLSDDAAAADDSAAVLGCQANDCGTLDESAACQRGVRSPHGGGSGGYNDAASPGNELENCSNFNELSLVDVQHDSPTPHK